MSISCAYITSTITIRKPLSGSKVASCNFDLPVKCEDIPRGSSGIDFDVDQETPDGAKVSVKGNFLNKNAFQSKVYHPCGT